MENAEISESDSRGRQSRRLFEMLRLAAAFRRRRRLCGAAEILISLKAVKNNARSVNVKRRKPRFGFPPFILWLFHIDNIDSGAGPP